MTLFGGVIPITGITFFMFCIFAVLFAGYALGRITIKGVSLGDAGVFVMALVFGAFCFAPFESQMIIKEGEATVHFVEKALEIVERLGLILFVTSVGFIAGPKFFGNMKKNFKSYVLLGFVVILAGAVGAIACIMMGFMWFMGVVFLAFFINLCSGRTLNAFKSDMAIMRSMGIPVKTIRIGMYVRMLLSLIPAFIMLCLMAILIFASPAFNSYFVYLCGWQYALIVLGMLILTVRVTHKQIRRLFGESVKKALKGGNVA